MKKITFKDLILFENDDFIVINKPPFFATLDDRHEADKDNMIALARAYCPSAQMAHRLDKETSGCLAVAKHPEAYRHLSLQFEHRQVGKIYHAVVEGIYNYQQVEVYKPILPLSNGSVKIDYDRGKEAYTVFQTLEAFKKHTLIECHPLTGRMHQIRIHLAILGSPISGDERYGGKPFYLSEIKKHYNLKKDTEELPLIQRVALHAYRLHFEGLQQEAIQVEAPYPKDFQALINQLNKHN